MPNSYTSWSVEKLNKEIEKIQRVIKSKESLNKKAALAKIVSVARSSGFELHELLGESSEKKRTATGSRTKPKRTKNRGKVAPKYKNPDKSEETWTGRGRQPIWVREWLKQGGSMDDVTISK